MKIGDEDNKIIKLDDDEELKELSPSQTVSFDVIKNSYSKIGKKNQKGKSDQDIRREKK